MSTKYKDFLAKQEAAKGACPFCTMKEDIVITREPLAYMTLALAPYHKDHLLIIPTRHVKHIFDVTQEEHVAIRTLEHRAWDLLKRLGYTGVSLIVREGKSSGGTVEHLHYHAIPDTRLGNMDINGDERTVLGPAEHVSETTRLRGASKGL
jgi:diadenosine tetraphosphate (Ap4A) HIT family hydrolase